MSKKDQYCKDEINDLANEMNSEKRKEIAKVKKEKDDEKHKEMDLHDIKMKA